MDQETRKKIHQLLSAASDLGGKELRNQVFALLPWETKIDFNYGECKPLKLTELEKDSVEQKNSQD
jgi:hypothetical protein